MADVTEPPERQLRLERTARSKAGNIAKIGRARPTSVNNPARPERPVGWPFKAETCSPLAWWRRMPPDAFGGAERLLLAETIGRISVLRGGDDLMTAISGDVAAAIRTALGLMPIEKITMRVDITMTALMCVALDGNAAPALVMAQVVGLTDVGHGLAGELAAAWLAFGERHSGEPAKFAEAEIVLLAAFKEHRNKSDA
jgi:hypothetical protein